MKPGYRDYVRHAFNARPMGMFVPPNWIGLGVFALLGLLNPGFWVMGLGLELAYLGMLAGNARFRRLVHALEQQRARRTWQAKVDDLVRELDLDGQQTYRALEVRCRSILELQFGAAAPGAGLQEQADGLGRLLWLYLRLLSTRQAIVRMVRESAGSDDQSEKLAERVRLLEEQLRRADLGEELRKSLSGQIEILQQRLEKRREAREKLAYLDAELARIREQVELIREQAVLAADPEVVSRRIDQIAETLGGTSQWVREQQRIYGAVEDLLSEPPPLAVPTAGKEKQ